MTVEELIRELSMAEGFYNDVKLVKKSHYDRDLNSYLKEYDYKIRIDNSDVYIEIQDEIQDD